MPRCPWITWSSGSELTFKGTIQINTTDCSTIPWTFNGRVWWVKEKDWGSRYLKLCRALRRSFTAAVALVPFPIRHARSWLHLPLLALRISPVMYITNWQGDIRNFRMCVDSPVNWWNSDWNAELDRPLEWRRHTRKQKRGRRLRQVNYWKSFSISQFAGNGWPNECSRRRTEYEYKIATMQMQLSNLQRALINTTKAEKLFQDSENR